MSVDPTNQFLFCGICGFWSSGAFGQKVKVLDKGSRPQRQGLGSLELGQLVATGQRNGQAGQDVDVIGDARQVLLFEEICCFEEVGVGHFEAFSAGTQVGGDVFHLLEGQSASVDQRNGTWRDGVEKIAQDFTGFQCVVKVVIRQRFMEHFFDPFEDVLGMFQIKLELGLGPHIVFQFSHGNLGFSCIG